MEKIKLFSLENQRQEHLKKWSKLEKEFNKEKQLFYRLTDEIKKLIGDSHLQNEDLDNVIGEYQVQSGADVFGYRMEEGGHTGDKLVCVKYWKENFHEL